MMIDAPRQFSTTIIRVALKQTCQYGPHVASSNHGKFGNMPALLRKWLAQRKTLLLQVRQTARKEGAAKGPFI